MTEEQFYYLMVSIGFGFGTIFWMFLIYLIFAWKMSK